jgi:hypothetical protein
LLLLIIRKDEIEHAATRVLTQAQVNSEAAPKMFEEYIKIRYPYLEVAKQREKDEAIRMLLAEVKKGPFVIQPMGEPKLRSKLHKAVQRNTDPGVTSRLMSKIGRAMPV